MVLDMALLLLLHEFELVVELLHTVSLGLETKPSGVAVSSACRATVASSTAPVSSVDLPRMILSLSYSSYDSLELNCSVNRRIEEKSQFCDARVSGSIGKFGNLGF
jgi:hypothetical protein